MFYFGFLSSYLPYLLLIAAPLCYYLYGTVIDADVNFDENRTIVFESSDANYLDNSSIHYADVDRLIGNTSNYKSPNICTKSSDSKCISPPPTKDLYSGTSIWSRPPPQVIM